MDGVVLDGKAILLTGAGGGLGRAMAEALCAAGADVMAVDMEKAGLDRLASHVYATKARGRLLSTIADLRDPLHCHDVVAQCCKRFGRLDGLVNNAGLGLRTIREDYYVNNLKFWEVPDESWQAILETNVTAAFRLARSAIETMRSQGWGRIVNVTTSMDTMIRRGWTPYGPSKAALEACSAIWAKDLDGSGVTVNVLVPGGPADTAMVPFASSPNRAAMVQPDVMKAPIVWLMSEDSDGFTGNRITGTGWDCTLDGRQAAAKAAAPAAWPGVGQQAIWPDDRT